MHLSHLVWVCSTVGRRLLTTPLTAAPSTRPHLPPRGSPASRWLWTARSVFLSFLCFLLIGGSFLFSFFLSFSFSLSLYLPVFLSFFPVFLSFFRSLSFLSVSLFSCVSLCFSFSLSPFSSISSGYVGGRVVSLLGVQCTFHFSPLY